MPSIFEIQDSIAALGADVSGKETIQTLNRLATCAEEIRQDALAFWLRDIASTFISDTIGPRAGEAHRRLGQTFWQLSMRFPTDSIEGRIAATAHALLTRWGKLAEG